MAQKPTAMAKLFSSQLWAQAVCKAALVGDHAGLERLLSQNDKPLCGRALAVAAEGGHERCAKMLLARSNPSWRDRHGLTPLMNACKQGRLGMVRLLLAAGGENELDRSGACALAWAVHGGSAACVEAMLSKRSAKASDARGITPLMAACSLGRRECASLLLPHSELGARDIDGDSARDWALRQGQPDMAALLDAWELSQELGESTAQAPAQRARAL